MLLRTRGHSMDITARKKDERKGSFFTAMDNLVRRLGAVLEPKQTPISIFKARYSGILDEADHGRIQMITQGRKHYVLLTEAQLVLIMDADVNKKRSLADTLGSLTPPKERLDTSQVMLAGSGHDPFILPDSVR